MLLSFHFGTLTYLFAELGHSNGPRLRVDFPHLDQVCRRNLLLSDSAKTETYFLNFVAGAYNIKTQMIPGLVGGFSEARPKSDIEWACYRAAQTPGPQDYDAKKASHVFGGKFGLTLRVRHNKLCFVVACCCFCVLVWLLSILTVGFIFPQVNSTHPTQEISSKKKFI